MKTKCIHMAKRVCVFLPFYLFTFLPLSAQTFTQRLQQTVSGGGRVTIHQDAAIDELVNGKPAPLPKRTKEVQQQAPRKQQPTADAREKKQTADTRTQQQPDKLFGEQPLLSVDSIQQEPLRTHQVMGYRIQVFAGGKTRADRQKAEQTANTLKSLFPDQKFYVHFYSPRWICRMGNFRTLEEAKEKLNEVVRMGYDTATLVRGKVTVPY